MRKGNKARKWAMATACMLVLGVATSVALADRPGRGFGRPDGPPDPERRMQRITEALDLSENQAAELHALLESHRESMRASREGMRAAREFLKEKITATELDEVAIREASAAVAALETERAVSRAQQFQQLRAVLSTEQLAEFQALRERRHERRSERRGGKPGREGRTPRGF